MIAKGQLLPVCGFHISHGHSRPARHGDLLYRDIAGDDTMAGWDRYAAVLWGPYGHAASVVSHKPDAGCQPVDHVAACIEKPGRLIL